MFFVNGINSLLPEVRINRTNLRITNFSKRVQWEAIKKHNKLRIQNEYLKFPMIFPRLILLFLLTTSYKASLGGPGPPSDDTMVISKSVIDKIFGSAYIKRATQYQIVNQQDTSKFLIIFTESIKTAFEQEGS